MEADGPRLDGTATSAGAEEGRVGPGGCFILPKEGGGQAQKISRATPVPGEAASWERTATASSFLEGKWQCS